MKDIENDACSSDYNGLADHQPKPWPKGRHRVMTEEEYYSFEFTDDFLNTQADIGESYLEENGYNCMPTEKEIHKMVKTGYAMIFAQWIRANFEK